MPAALFGLVVHLALSTTATLAKSCGHILAGPSGVSRPTTPALVPHAVLPDRRKRGLAPRRVMALGGVV